MIDYRRNRRLNLLALERRFGSLTALSERTNISASYLSQLKKFRHMGDKTARRIEKKLSLPEGWMDIAHAPDAESSTRTLVIPQSERTKDFLNTYLSLPEALRAHLESRAQALRSYVERLTPFQRTNLMRPPPSDLDERLSWELGLDQEIVSIVKELFRDPLGSAAAETAAESAGAGRRK